VLLVLITVPTLGLLFLQNQEVQNSVSDYLTKELSSVLGTEISVASVHYSFFKRLQLHDFYMSDQSGDTLMYAELCNIRVRKFRPDKKRVDFRKISLDNALFQIIMNDQRVSSLQFFVDSLKRDLPPEEKVVLTIDQIVCNESRFRRIDNNVEPKPGGIDFTDLYIKDIRIDIEDFQFRYDTTFMDVAHASGKEVSGFDMKNVGFNLTFSKKFMTFSDGWVNTPISRAIVPVVDFRYNDARDFREIYDSVTTYISSDGSLLDFHDLAYFFPQVRDLQGKMVLNGSVFGKFGDLRGENIYIDYLDNTRLRFDMRLAGLPSEDSLYMDFDFREFRTIPSELRTLTTAYNFAFLRDSTAYPGLEQVMFRGDFRGYMTDFETTGLIRSNLGNINIDLNMKPDSLRHLHFKGDVSSGGFMLGRLTGAEPELGRIVFNLDVDGRNRNGAVNGTVAGTIDTLGIYNYNYSNIRIQGAFSERKFDGSLYIRDPNIDLSFAGRVDFEEEIPAFDFTVDVANLRPFYLNLRDDDPEYFASFLLKTRMTGNKLANLNGRIELINSLFKRTGSQVQLYNVILETGNSEDHSFISLESDQVKASIQGKYKLRDLPGTFFGLINDHFAILPGENPAPDTSMNFDFGIELMDVEPVMAFFFPRFSLAPDISITGSYKPSAENYLFRCEGLLPYFAYQGYAWDQMDFTLQSDTGSMQLSMGGDQLLATGGFEIKRPDIEAIFSDNSNELSLQWSNDSTPEYSGYIRSGGRLDSTANGDLQYTARLLPSRFLYNNRKFTLPRSQMRFSKGEIAVDSFFIQGTEQFLVVDGKYSADPHDSITLAIQNFNMHMINDIYADIPLDISGSLSGHTTFKNASGNPLITSKLEARNVVINEQQFGNTMIRADWIRTTQELELAVRSEDDFTPNNLDIRGYYNPFDNSVDFDIKLSELNLASFAPVFKGTIEQLSGTSDLSMTVDGSLSDPNINGMIGFRDAALTVTETKSDYHITDRLRIYRNDIYFDDFVIQDENGNRMVVTGNILTSDLSSLYFNIDMMAENFNFLSTTRFDNEQFYGSIYATAEIDLNGPPNRLVIKANASTSDNTNLKLPLYNPSQIQTTDFITFIRSESSEVIETSIPPRKRSTVMLDMELDINANTDVQLIFDPKVGDIIEASGNGTLSLELNENGDFSMFGTVLVEDGEYLFTLQNVINKRFRIKPGGTISWNGSPTSATVDLEAIYETKASTYSLAPEPTEEMKKRIPVHCLLSLQGELRNPTIEPSIELPTAEPETRSLVETSIGTDEELMRQFISLLVINNFISNPRLGSNPISSSSSGVAGVTASELLSNQLSNWLSQISNDFDIGVNYRPGDAISSDEVEVALSTQLLNDRIIFTGNLDVLGEEVNTPGGPSNIVGDFDLEFRVTEKVSIKAFNRVNDDRIVRPSLYTQGVGLIYRNEFNSVGELFSGKKEENENEKAHGDAQEKALIRDDENDL